MSGKRNVSVCRGHELANALQTLSILSRNIEKETEGRCEVCERLVGAALQQPLTHRRIRGDLIFIFKIIHDLLKFHPKTHIGTRGHS